MFIHSEELKIVHVLWLVSGENMMQTFSNRQVSTQPMAFTLQFVIFDFHYDKKKTCKRRYNFIFIQFLFKFIPLRLKQDYRN